MRPLYFVNWWFDGLVVGGLSIILWAAFAAFYPVDGARTIFWLGLALLPLVNYPHFSATVYRLYQSPENIRQFPVTAYGLPIVLFSAVLACVWQPGAVLPYFMMLYLLWSGYHYSGQTIGLTMIYARRAGFAIGRRERIALSLFVYATLLWGVIRLQQATGRLGAVYNVPVPSFPVPMWLYAAAQAGAATGALVFAGLALLWCLRERRLLPPIVLVPAAAHFVWFVPATGVASFWGLIPFFHSLQYLLIALAMQLKLRIDGAGGEHSWRRVRAEAWRWGGRNLLGGMLLFVGLPALFVWLPLPVMTIAGVMAAAVNIHHFFVDGVIWKLRDPATSAALTMNFAELVEEAAAPVPAAASA